MKFIKAAWRSLCRFVFGDEYNLWWSGFFFVSLIDSIQKYPASSRDAWALAFLGAQFFALVFCTWSGVRYVNRGRK